ncbi:MAG: acetate--CoA ligase family protein [Steroidobacteraceae bacterium]
MTSLTSSHSLTRLFAPKSVALIGVTEKSPFSASLMHTFDAYGFSGELYLINKRGGTVFGRPAVTSLTEIGKPIDLVYIMVPLAVVLDTLEEVIAAGCRNVVVLTSGFAETGAEGKALQDRLAASASKHGVNLLGPNSLGFHHVRGRMALSPIPPASPLIDGELSIVCQSGASASELYAYAHAQNIGLNYLIHTGNEAAIGLADVVDYFVDDPGTKSIAIFCESVRQPETFARAARRAAVNGKPIVILKVGASELSAKVAQAHTGSLVGDDRVFDAMCRKLGVARTHSIEDLILTAGMLARIKPVTKPGVAFVSLSGGACTLVADQADRVGLPLPALQPQTQQALRGLLAAYASTLNPLDVTGGVLGTPDVVEKIIDVVNADPNIGLVAVNFELTERKAGLPPLLAIGRALAKPESNGLLLTLVAKGFNANQREIIKEMGGPLALSSIDHGARALAQVMWWNRRNQEMKQEAALPPKNIVPERAKPQSERETLQYLRARGVPVVPQRLATSRDDAIAAAKSLGDVVVLKIASPDIAHKTEAGGVQLGLKGSDQVGAAYDAILASVRKHQPNARIDGVLVSPMREKRLELFVGTMRDPSWGPVILAGLGGIYVEVLKDTALRPLPITRADAVEMLQSLRAARLLQGYRGMPGVDLDAAADAIVKIGDAALALGPDLVALEINPLSSNGKTVEALDALAVWA